MSERSYSEENELMQFTTNSNDLIANHLNTENRYSSIQFFIENKAENGQATDSDASIEQMLINDGFKFK